MGIIKEGWFLIQRYPLKSKGTISVPFVKYHLFGQHFKQRGIYIDFKRK
jgi:hypothetical protein